MNLQLNSLLITVKKRLYDNLQQYWINKHKENQIVQRFFGVIALITTPLAYWSLTQHWNLLAFLLLSILSIGSIMVYLNSFFDLNKTIQYKKLLNDSLSQEQLYQFCEDNVLEHFSSEDFNTFTNFNSDLSHEELQQLTQIKFNHKQLEYLYTLLKNDKTIKLYNLFDLEKKEEKTVENYQEVFNKFVIKNELDNTFNIDLKLTKEEEKESYYEKYL